MRNVIITLFSAILLVGCSNEVQTKDVSFKITVKCDDLTLNDYYGSTLVQSVHKSDVDTAYIDFKGMAYGKHELELVVDGKKGRSVFMVSDSTARAYIISTVNMGFTFDDELDEEIIYEF